LKQVRRFREGRSSGEVTFSLHTFWDWRSFGEK
jgi:hypothetical protein